MNFVLKKKGLAGLPNLVDHAKYTTIVSRVTSEPKNIAIVLTMDKHICNHYQKRSLTSSSLEPPPRTKPLKLCSNQHAKGCALVYPPRLLFKNELRARARGKAHDRTIQSGMDFEVDSIIIVGEEGMKTEIGFLFGLRVRESDRSVETVIFG